MSAPADSRAEPGLAATLALYTLARLALLAAIAGLLLLAGTPLVIALLVALIVALPLSMLVFRGLRARLDTALAVSRARRAQQREALRAGLRGDGVAPGGPPVASRRDTPLPDTLSGDGPEPQPDAGGDRPDQQ
jgi:hypothetical protein